MATASWTWIKQHSALLGLTIALGVGGYLHPHVVRQVDVQFTDQIQRLRGNLPPGNITIVAIDDHSLQQAANSDLSDQTHLHQLDQWPWPRQIHGLVLNRLIQAGARLVAIDFLFDSPSIHGELDDAAFVSALKQHKNSVVVGTQVLNSRGPVAGLSLQTLHPPIAEVLGRSEVGLLNGEPDGDGIIRQRPGNATFQLRQTLGENVPNGLAKAMLNKLPLTETNIGSNLLLEPYGPPRTIRTIPIWNVLENRTFSELKEAGTFKDQLVLIGPTAAVFQDLHQTIFAGAEGMPGVEIHATELGNRIDGRGLHQLLTPAWWGLAIGLTVLGIGLLLERNERPLLRLGIATGLGILCCAGGTLSIQLINQALPAASMASALVALGLVSSSEATVRLQLQKRRLRQSLGRYLSPAVAAEIADKPNEAKDLLGGQLINVVVLMSDIRSFTAFTKEMTEQGDVRGLVQRLNTYFSEVVEAIHAEEGTVDKFIGDATLAVFGAPIQRPDEDNAAAAIRAALSMHQRLTKLNQQWSDHGKPQWQQVIALSYGWVVSGNIGSSVRMDYTVIGDAVNTASRLESIAKQCNETIVMSDSLAQQLAGKWPLRDLGEFAIRGQGEQRVYALRF